MRPARTPWPRRRPPRSGRSRYAALGLTAAEYARIAGNPRPPADRRRAGHLLGDVERALLLQVVPGAPAAVRREGAAEPTALLAGIGQNAGVVDIGQGYAVTFKIESHNHPSYVEPYQGAATGVGGIVRDILAMGARPVAVMDALRFGPADAPDTRRVLPGVVGGISFYGNCLGLPNIGGELAFDPCYAGNPLVNALCVGVHAARRPQEARGHRAGQPGRPVRLADRAGRHRRRVGAGQRVVRRAAASGPKRPSVQVGDPFMEKLLIECCLELYAAGLVAAIQDLGAAGVSCATTELAAAGDGGHASRPGRRAAPRRLARARRDPDERVAGAHDGRGRARPTWPASRTSAPSGTCRRP